MPASRFMTSSQQRPETAPGASRFLLRLTFAGDVSSDVVIQHLRETFNDDGSLIDAAAVAEPAATHDRTTTG